MKRKLFGVILAMSSFVALLSCTQLAVAQTSGAAGGTDSETAAGTDQAAQSSTPGTDSSTQDQATEPADAGANDLFAEPAPPTRPSNQTDQTNQPAAPGGAATALPQEQALQQQQQANLDADARQRQHRDLLAGIQFGQATSRGLTIANVAAGTIFSESGLRAGDVIVAYRGQPIRSEADFARWAVFQAGQRVPVTVLRGDREEETIFVTFPQETTDQTGQYQANRPEFSSGGPAFLGVGFDTQMVNVAAVRDVLPGSAAEQAGLREGDVIVALNGEPIASFREAMSLIGSLRAGDSLEIEYTRRIPNRAQAVLGVRPTSGPGAVSALPGEDVRVYRGGPEYDEPPIEGQYVEPPSGPSGEPEGANELP